MTQERSGATCHPTTIDHNKADVYSRPNARIDGDGQLEVRASAAGNCRRALWYDACEWLGELGAHQVRGDTNALQDRGNF